MSYSLLSRTKTVARKPHSCVWCGHPIMASSQYVREASIFDGSFQNLAFHEACLKATNDYFSEVGEGEFPDDSEMPFHALYQLEAKL